MQALPQVAPPGGRGVCESRTAILQSRQGARYQTARPRRRQPGIRMRVTSQVTTDRRADSDMAAQATGSGQPPRGVAML